jgi:HAD superfamily hydrolase (TIGR01509 family)
MQLGEEIGVPFGDDMFNHTFGMHNNQIVPYWLGRTLPTEERDRLADRKEELYRKLLPTQARGLPGVVPFIDRLASEGYGLAVGSSGPMANVRMALEFLGVAKQFRALSTGEDVQHGKPDPQVFLVAAERLGLPPSRCVVFEDAPQGVEAGLRGGMRVVAITSSRDRQALSAAHRVIDGFDELSVADIESLLA